MNRALVLLLVPMAVFAKEKEKEKPSTKAKWGPFVAYDGARKLCQEHVSGSTLHISWQSYASADAVASVVAFYEKELGKKAEVGSGDFTLHGVRPDDLISIYPVEKAEARPSCSEKPKAGERTVILVSEAQPVSPK